ncbi:helix-turn-helix domain-containing protein (plasmid) [Pseudoalteromonas espejiana]
MRDFSGISINTVSDFENGTGSLSIGRAFDLMEALGLEVKIDVVVPQSDERTKNKLITQIHNLVADHE